MQITFFAKLNRQSTNIFLTALSNPFQVTWEIIDRDTFFVVAFDKPICNTDMPLQRIINDSMGNYYTIKSTDVFNVTIEMFDRHDNAVAFDIVDAAVEIRVP
ncbi:MAG TPA: hypothetical protein PLA68_09425 [Panacibacter sp.]|nr:hypothetical protein [Panacibacter sp.]